MFPWHFAIYMCGIKYMNFGKWTALMYLLWTCRISRHGFWLICVQQNLSVLEYNYSRLPGNTETAQLSLSKHNLIVSRVQSVGVRLNPNVCWLVFKDNTFCIIPEPGIAWYLMGCIFFVDTHAGLCLTKKIRDAVTFLLIEKTAKYHS